ncbi:endonuclease III domain-containing protein [Myxococcota bacterium]|nr:endonuclease III domain-containing protein [Myxococcota bacterium]
MTSDETGAVIKDIYRRLLADGGWQDWWPGDSPFEIAVGAILTQNTNWKGVEKSIANLKAADKLSAAAILGCDNAVLGELIRPSGYFNVKTARLKSLSAFLTREGAPGVTGLACEDRTTLRQALLSVNGVGRETADSIMLYALGVPIFVVDAYTRRILGRIGLIDPGADYDDIQRLLEAHIDPDSSIYGDYHAQIVRCGKEFCQKRPKCLKCPLLDLCHEGMGNDPGRTV